MINKTPSPKQTRDGNEGDARYVARGDEGLPEQQASSYSVDPALRQPKGDHNRRLALPMEADAFAAAAEITVEELKEYEF